MKKLERSLGLKEILIVGFSAMLGTGVFITPGIIYNATGASLFLAYILGAILIIPAATSMSELATSMPSSGGIYVYTDRTFGPLLGTVVGFGLWLSLLFKSAFALKGFGIYLQVFTDFPVIWTALFTLVVVTVLNVGGVSKVAGSLSIIVMICLFSILATGLISLDRYSFNNMEPFFSHGAEGFMVALSLGVGAYAGLTKLTAIAEEVKDPEINLSKGILYSLLGMSLVYYLTTLMFATTLTNAEFSDNLRPLYTLVSEKTGSIGGGVLAIIAILTLISMANAGVLAASRFPFAMSRDHLLPKSLGKIHSRFLTPLTSIVLSSLIIALIILTMDVEKVAKLASVFIIQMFILVNITVIALRESRAQWYKPKYRSPLYPGQHLFGIVSGLILLFYMGQLTLFSMLLVGVPSLIIYFFYGRKTNRKGVIGIRGKRKDLVEGLQTGKNLKPITLRSLESLELNKKAKVVVPLFGREVSAETLTEVANVLAEGEGVEVAHITEVPEQTDLNDLEDPVGLKALQRRVNVMADEKSSPITFESVATYDVTKTLYDIGKRLHCHWMLIGWAGKRGRFTLYNPMSWIKNHLKCHLVWFSDKGVRNFRKILVVTKGLPSDQVVLDAALILAKGNNAKLTIAHEVSENISLDQDIKKREKIEKIIVALQGRVSSEQILFDEEAQSIIDISVAYDLIVIAYEPTSFVKMLRLDRNNRILTKAACSVFCINVYE